MSRITFFIAWFYEHEVGVEEGEQEKQTDNANVDSSSGIVKLIDIIIKEYRHLRNKR